MLEIVKYNEDEYSFPCLLVLGCFDGLHIGHAELLKKAKLQAKINGLDLGVMLFAEGKGGKQLLSFEERLSFLEQYNVKFVLKIDFDDSFKQIKPLEFLSCLEDKLNVKAYMSGKDFRFGQGKKGKSSTLKSYAEDEENGVWYMSVKDVTFGDQKVSTTLIKSMLENGDVKTASELLGRSYSVSGTVNGAENGALNIAYPENKFEVKQGAYKVKCALGENEYCGVANYCKGALEVYLDALDGEHVGETAKIEFLESADEAQQAELAVTEASEAQPEEQPAEVPAEEQPAVEEVVEAPAEEVQPEEITEEQPAEETPADDFEEELNETATVEAVTEEQPAEETEPHPAEEVPTEEETVEETPAEQPAEEQTEETSD